MWEKVFTLDEFVAQEHRLVDEFRDAWAQTHEEGLDRLTADQWVEHYNEFLAARESGESEEEHE